MPLTGGMGAFRLCKRVMQFGMVSRVGSSNLWGTRRMYDSCNQSKMAVYSVSPELSGDMKWTTFTRKPMYFPPPYLWYVASSLRKITPTDMSSHGPENIAPISSKITGGIQAADSSSGALSIAKTVIERQKLETTVVAANQTSAAEPHAWCLAKRKGKQAVSI